MTNCNVCTNLILLTFFETGSPSLSVIKLLSNSLYHQRWPCISDSTSSQVLEAYSTIPSYLSFPSFHNVNCILSPNSTTFFITCYSDDHFHFFFFEIVSCSPLAWNEWWNQRWPMDHRTVQPLPTQLFSIDIKLLTSKTKFYFTVFESLNCFYHHREKPDTTFVQVLSLKGQTHLTSVIQAFERVNLAFEDKLKLQSHHIAKASKTLGLGGVVQAFNSSTPGIDWRGIKASLVYIASSVTARAI